jgi:hypothetical protein
MSPGLVPVGCLALASGWQAWMVLSDCRWIGAHVPDGRVYRPELGWSDAALVDARRRWARAGLVAAVGLVVAETLLIADVVGVLVPASAVVVACTTILAWLAGDRRRHHGRYTLICLATLAAAVFLYRLAALVFDDGDHDPYRALGLVVSVFASQLYLVAGIRKLTSSGFMSGRVVAHNLAYALFQGAAGNRDFPSVLGLRGLARLVEGKAFLRGCRIASAVTVAAEVAIGLGAAGLLPRALTLALAVPVNLAFLLISPKRIVAFIVSAFGLLVLATADPLLPVFG